MEFGIAQINAAIDFLLCFLQNGATLQSWSIMTRESVKAKSPKHEQ
jgi:hypothetical protein